MSYKTQKKSARSSISLLLAVAGLTFMALAAFLLQLRSSPRLSAITNTPEPQHSVEEAFPEIRRVSLVESKAAFDDGSAVFIDVRDTSAYAEAHIPGALSFPLAELEKRLGELDSSRWIITYCT